MLWLFWRNILFLQIICVYCHTLDDIAAHNCCHIATKLRPVRNGTGCNWLSPCLAFQNCVLKAVWTTVLYLLLSLWGLSPRYELKTNSAEYISFSCGRLFTLLCCHWGPGLLKQQPVEVVASVSNIMVCILYSLFFQWIMYLQLQ